MRHDTYVYVNAFRPLTVLRAPRVHTFIADRKFQRKCASQVESELKVREFLENDEKTGVRNFARN